MTKALNFEPQSFAFLILHSGFFPLMMQIIDCEMTEKSSFCSICEIQANQEEI